MGPCSHSLCPNVHDLGSPLTLIVLGVSCALVRAFLRMGRNNLSALAYPFNKRWIDKLVMLLWNFETDKQCAMWSVPIYLLPEVFWWEEDAFLFTTEGSRPSFSRPTYSRAKDGLTDWLTDCGSRRPFIAFIEILLPLPPSFANRLVHTWKHFFNCTYITGHASCAKWFC